MSSEYKSWWEKWEDRLAREWDCEIEARLDNKYGDECFYLMLNKLRELDNRLNEIEKLLVDDGR